jgi:hypothetical protein
MFENLQIMDEASKLEVQDETERLLEMPDATHDGSIVDPWTTITIRWRQSRT